jgi:cysteine desulfurase family protein (TIGR01976 family)
MFDPSAVRRLFPALQQTHNGLPVAFFDNPGGTQCPQEVIDAVAGYLSCDNANHAGAFATSQRTDAMLDDARQAMADMLGANAPEEIVFGANMTTLTFSLSRALGRRLAPGDEIVVTRLDHDANIAPWLHVARDTGAVIRWADIHDEDCTLDMDSLARLLTPRTRVVAVGYASNAVGTINDVKAIVSLAHDAGALVFVDAVQYAPHGPIDVGDLDCDFLACSAYKFYGPHVGVLYGKLAHLDALEAYKVRPAGDRPPYKFETGTVNFEGIAGTRAAVEYLGRLGASSQASPATTRRERVVAGLRAGADYERGVNAHLLDGLAGIPGLRVRGITGRDRLHERVPTVAFTLEGHHPRRIAEALADRGLFVWDGHYYAVALVERLGLAASGGMVRVGLAHYNTVEEIDRLIEAVEGVSRT